MFGEALADLFDQNFGSGGTGGEADALYASSHLGSISMAESINVALTPVALGKLRRDDLNWKSSASRRRE